MNECYLMIWCNDGSHYWYRKMNNRRMAEVYMNFSKMYLADYQYRYIIKPELIQFASAYILDSSYDDDLLSYIYRNFERKIYERFRKNVVNQLLES